MPSSRFLTLADVAETLHVSVSEVMDLIHSRELPAIQVGYGGPWRVEAGVLASFIEDRYEESRRISLWRQGEYADLPELSEGRIIRPEH